jgi:hypothetical protein
MALKAKQPAPPGMNPKTADRDNFRPHYTKDDLRDMGNIGFKVFMGIKEQWNLSPSQCMALLGLEDSNRSTWSLWLARFRSGKDIGSFDRDQLERLSHLAQIHRGVISAFPDDRHGLGWLAAPNANPVFQGKAPLERLLAGGMRDLAAVQSYLEAVLLSSAG